MFAKHDGRAGIARPEFYIPTLILVADAVLDFLPLGAVALILAWFIFYSIEFAVSSGIDKSLIWIIQSKKLKDNNGDGDDETEMPI